MFAFWAVAGLLAAASAILILRAAAGRATASGAEDPTLAVYRRQLAEIDDLAARGLLAEPDRKVAHAEAGRRLLGAADAGSGAWIAGSAGRRLALIAAASAPVLGALIYVAVGTPGLADQPFAARLDGWRRADPTTLDPPRMAAVLRAVAGERPTDPEAFRYLALAEGAAGETASAVRALRRAITLQPGRADLWEMLGEALVAEADGEVTPNVQAAFREALKRDPKSVSARFYLARAEVEQGDRAAGLSGWRALLADLPAGDPRRAGLAQAVADAEKGPAAPQAAAEEGQDEMIRSMVEGLAARLKDSPDDAQGWVRLVRAYAVLGQVRERDAALSQARDRFRGRAEVLQALDEAAATRPSAQLSGVPQMEEAR